MADPGRLDELKRKFEENPRRYFAPLANEYRKAGDPDMAIELCRTYLPQQPSHMSGYIVYGQSLHDAGRDEEAAAVFHQALALDPENIIALRQLGDIARTSGDSGAAIQWYRKVLELDPRNDEIASFITALENPGGPAQREWSGPERPVPPPIRPEPELQGTTVALEDLVSQPDLPRTTPIMAMPAREAEARPHAAEEPPSQPPAPPSPHEPAAEPPPAPQEPVSQSLVEITFEEEAFEAVQWPVATPEEQRVVEQHGEPVAAVPPTQEDAAEELLRFSDFVPEEEHLAPAEMQLPPEHEHEVLDSAHSTQPEGPEQETPARESPEPTELEPAVSAAPTTTAPQPTPQPAPQSPFVNETMAELYLQQGLRGEALAIYRQLAARRDDPALRQRIAELEHTEPAEDAAPAPAPTPAPESEPAPRVQPAAGETVRAFFSRIGARQPAAHAHIAAENERGLAALFGTKAMDDDDIAAAQSLAGAFSTSERPSASHD